MLCSSTKHGFRRCCGAHAACTAFVIILLHSSMRSAEAKRCLAGDWPETCPSLSDSFVARHLSPDSVLTVAFSNVCGTADNDTSSYEVYATTISDGGRDGGAQAEFVRIPDGQLKLVTSLGARPTLRLLNITLLDTSKIPAPTVVDWRVMCLEVPASAIGPPRLGLTAPHDGVIDTEVSAFVRSDPDAGIKSAPYSRDMPWNSSTRPIAVLWVRPVCICR